MMYDLPRELEVEGTVYPIRADFRAVLDICAALNDPDLDDRQKAYAALVIFYPDLEDMPPEHFNAAIARCFWFINGGEDTQDGGNTPRLMDWEQDFRHIAGPVSRVIGAEVRELAFLHWWTFLSAYFEIGDCFFAHIVAIRDKKARGKPLDKTEREFYRKNRRYIDLKTRYSESDQRILQQFGIK